MSTLESIRASLRADRKDWERIAEMADVGFSTIEKIAYGVIDDPAFTKVERIQFALARLADEKRSATKSSRAPRDAS